MVLVLWEIRDRQAPGKRRLIFATSSDVLLLQKIQRVYKNLWKALTWYTYSQKYIFVYHLTISLSKFDFNVKFLILWVHIEILRGKNGSKKKLKVSFFGECTKMQLITSKNFNIQTCFSQLLCFSILKNGDLKIR